MNKTYSELRRLSTFDERFEYLKLGGQVGYVTFGHDRYVNQGFYLSHEWRMARRNAIIRDEGCDLGIPGFEIYSEILVHHINPISLDDIVHHEEWILDPEFLITTTKKTHNALHFGNERKYPEVVTARTAHDTKLW